MNKLNFSQAIIEHFANHYLQFIALAPHLERSVADALCRSIWQHTYESYYRVEKKAA